MVELPQALTIVGGDMNLAMYMVLDRTSINPESWTNMEKLEGFKGAFGLQDVWRVIHQKEKAYSYY